MPQDNAQRPHPDIDDEHSPGNDSSPDRAGTYFLGRYRVVDEIGIGGMASVHLARMDGPGGFQKWVAIKRIHPHLVEDDTFVHMFLDEARIAARISHPNVATVFELGKHEDTYWIAMEYLHGEPLREVMRRTEEIGQPMPPEIACRVIADAAEGLHAAHELLGKNGEKLGLVHRDVTPHNLFVTYDGTTKVVDFGIAKFSSRMASTRAGTLKGKLAYMSPEQVGGEQIDRRTDVFALGVVLWELTTGQRLFRMESDLDTLAKVQECNVPRPSSVVRGYPVDLEKIAMKALAKQKNERFKTARELSRALQSLLMRRGLFIASDEVAAYTQSIFADRIRKREEHLRWAAEVTQTINLDTKPSPPAVTPAWSEPSSHTFNSDVQAAQAPPTTRPRPAAGAPAGPGVSLQQTGASAPTNPRPGALDPGRRSTLPSPVPETLRPARGPAAKGASDHPAKQEAPTMRASPRARTDLGELGDLPNLGMDEDFDDTDDTIVTSTRPELESGVPLPLPAAGRPAPRSVAPPPPRNNSAPPVITGLAQTSTAHVDSPFGRAPVLRQGSLSGEIPDPLSSIRPQTTAAPPQDPHKLFAPPADQKTVAAQYKSRKIPLWVVAAASAVFGLVFFAVALIIFITRTREAPSPPVAPLGSNGPFSSARSAFVSAISGRSSARVVPGSKLAAARAAPDREARP